MAKPTTRHGDSVATEDGQPWGSAAYDANAAATIPSVLSRHLAAVRDMPSVQQAWAHAYRAMRLVPGARALDVGCGTGIFLPLLGEIVGDEGVVVGVDHARALFDEARTRYVKSGARAALALVSGDAHRLPLADDVFDAAHTERVLMHLHDPDSALRELTRVVRPGGWVVAVEPDLAGWRIDFPDQEAIRALVRGFCESWRFPAIGLELVRRMTMAGLVDVEVEVVTEVERSLPDDVAVYYRQALDVAVARGWLSIERAERTLRDLLETAANGQFTSSSSLFVVAGRVPAR
ncbi:MAG: methyltransferase domain-containing protein [Thermomicrobiales bacterium]